MAVLGPFVPFADLPTALQPIHSYAMDHRFAWQILALRSRPLTWEG